MKDKHVNEIARLHFENFKDAFFCELGLNFLRVLYKQIIESPLNVGYVYEENSKVLGFITGSKNTNRFFYEAISKKFYVFILPVLLGIIKSPKIIFKVFQTFFYPEKNRVKEKAELVSIAVDKEQRGKNIGEKLFHSLLGHFRENKIASFKVVVDKHNIAANNFYQKMGFRHKYDFPIYGKKMNLYTYS